MSDDEYPRIPVDMALALMYNGKQRLDDYAPLTQVEQTMVRALIRDLEKLIDQTVTIS